MENAINHITVEGIGWIRSSLNVTSFGWAALPGKVHLSVSHVMNDSYINLHVTKNDGLQTNKPKIEICRIDRELLNELMHSFALHSFNAKFEQFNLDAFRRKRKGTPPALFSTLGKLKKPGNRFIFEKEFIDVCLDYLTVKKKKKLRISKNIGKGLLAFTTAKQHLEILARRFAKIPGKISFKHRQAFLISGNDFYFLTRVNGEWYRTKELSNPLEILQSCIGRSLSNQLAEKIQDAIGKVANAEVYQDVEKDDCPLLFIKNV